MTYSIKIPAWRKINYPPSPSHPESLTRWTAVIGNITLFIEVGSEPIFKAEFMVNGVCQTSKYFDTHQQATDFLLNAYQKYVEQYLVSFTIAKEAL